MLSNLHECDPALAENTSVFERIGFIHMMLATRPDLDGIYDGRILALRNGYRGYEYDYIIKIAPPSISIPIQDYIAALVRNDCAPLPTDGLEYILLSEEKKARREEVLTLNEKFNIRVASLPEVVNMGVDGIEPSTTAL